MKKILTGRNVRRTMMKTYCSGGDNRRSTLCPSLRWEPVALTIR